MRNSYTEQGYCSQCLRKYPPGYLAAKKKVWGENVRRSLADRKAKGLPIGRPKLRDDNLIVELRARGLSIRKIAKEIGCSSSSVAAAIKELK